jgi:pimeloyl-ACP methyl ester carboxylesterase
VERPRLLIVPEFTDLEWTIIPLLEEWAEVASYDAPGVGESAVSDEELEHLADDGPYRRERIAARGLEEASRRGWDRFVVVSDSGGILPACQLASMRPDAVAGMALGHACLSLGSEGERAPINAEVESAMDQLANQDNERFVQHALTQLTGGSYDTELAARILERVPVRLLIGAWSQGGDERVDRLIGGLHFHLLLVKHQDCLMYTDEGFEDAVEAFPRAATASVEDKPSVSEEFADRLREFCESLPSRA